MRKPVILSAGEEVKTLYSNAASSGIGTVAIPESTKEYHGKTIFQTKSSVGDKDEAAAIGGGVIIASDRDKEEINTNSKPVTRDPS